MMKARLILIIVSLLLALQGLVHAQEMSTNIPPFASTDEGALLVADANGEPQEVYSSRAFPYLDWNADGTILAFMQMDDEYAISLGIYDAASGDITILETPRLNTGFNLSWLSDGRILFAAENPENDPSNPVFYTDILAIEPVAGVQPEVLGSYESGVGCGGGSNIPADWLYGEETSGFMGNHLTLAETPAGILVSLNCGGTGIGLLDPTTGELTTISETLSRVVVSPDGTQAAGVEWNFEDPTVSSLVVMNLETLEAITIETPAAPDQVIWSIDGANLYYSTRTLTGNLIDDLSDDEKAVLNTAVGYDLTDMPAYQSDLYVVAAAGGESTGLASADAYAIGRMTDTESGLYYTTISNVGEWLQGVVTGEVDAMDFESAPPFVEAQVYQLVEGAEPMLVGKYHQFTPVDAM